MSGSQPAGKAFVSVVVPIYNEERYIASAIESIVGQDYGLEHMENLLVDGGSDDRTVEIIHQYQKEYPQILLLDNPRRMVQSALNIGIRAAKGEYIVRLDAHADFARDYISQSIDAIERTGAADVGGPTIAKGNTPVQRMVAASYRFPFRRGRQQALPGGVRGLRRDGFYGHLSPGLSAGYRGVRRAPQLQ